MSDIALEVKNITKEYKLYNSEKDRLKESFSIFKKCYHRNFYALSDVNFSIKKGEKVGIIGANGAGKSTLLKIITEVLKPTSGEIITNGRVAALLELGAGFNQDYTGIENIRLNGTLMGYSENEIAEKTKRIIEFADIGDFIDQPVKTYSSGMFVRLAFATQIFSEPDILIVDEALSVGDIRFQQKCYRAMESLMRDKTVVLVTHDTAAVTRFCQRVIWINKGKKVYDGEVVEGLNKYQEFLINQNIEDSEKEGKGDFVENQYTIETQKGDERYISIPDVVTKSFKGTGEAIIYQCGLFDDSLNIIEDIEPGAKVNCIYRVEFLKEVHCPLVGLTIRDRLGNVVIGINSQTLGVDLPSASGKCEYKISFTMPELNHGEYTVSLAVANGYQNDHIQLCWIDDALAFKILKRKYDIPGFIYIENGNVEIHKL